jgi:hypothetical protein
LKNGKQLDGSHTSPTSEAGSNGIVAFGWAVVVLMMSARSVVGRNALVRQGVGGGYYSKKYVALGIRTVFADDDGDEDDVDVSPVVHQTCHHWAYEVRQDALERFWAEGK